MGLIWRRGAWLWNIKSDEHGVEEGNIVDKVQGGGISEQVVSES